MRTHEHISEIALNRLHKLQKAQTQASLAVRLYNQSICRVDSDTENRLACRSIADSIYEAHLEVTAKPWGEVSGKTKETLIHYFHRLEEPLVTKALSQIRESNHDVVQFSTFMQYNTFLEKLVKRTLAESEYEGILSGKLPYMHHFIGTSHPEYFT